MSAPPRSKTKPTRRFDLPPTRTDRHDWAYVGTDGELTPDQENDLVRRAQAGDEEAFGTLMRSHYPAVFRLVASILRDEHAARDACQDVWLAVWKRLGSFRGDARLTTWIHPIAVRRAIDHLRSRRRWTTRFLPFLTRDEEESAEGPVVEPAGEGDPAQDLERAERVRRIQRAIDSLPPKHRAVLALREVNGLSYDEIAAATGLPRGTVMSRLFHARRLLAEKLSDLT